MSEDVSKESISRLRIFNASRKLFARLGYERTTVSLICKEAGVNRAMVSYYYGGKLALYSEIMEMACNTLLRSLREGVYNEKGPTQRLRAFVKINIEFQIIEPEETDMILREVSSNFADMGDIIEKHFIQMLAVLADVIQEGKDTGVFEESMPSTEISFFVLGAINSFFVLYRLMRQTDFSLKIDRENKDVLVDNLHNLIMKGISKKKVSSNSPSD